MPRSEKRKEYSKEWYEKNKEKIKEYQQSEVGKKTRNISKWKLRGLIGDYDAIYEKYINSTHCELCKQPFKNSKDRCMDHEHISGQFRHICCMSCNISMFDRNINANNTSGIKNVSKNGNSWKYTKKYKKQSFSYSNTNIYLTLWVKFYDHIILSNHPEVCCDID